ncbi:DUF3324 domain-containing protein [Listeria cornellensis]|nr:DUF3324 domain-containing protein [Listeria cornellensis]
MLTVPAKGSKKVEIEVTMPEKSYDGIILGAVQFKKVDKSNDESKNEGISIQNEYSYVVGVRLSETKQKVDPNLNLVSTKPGLVNYHTAVISKIQNDTAIPISNLDIEAEVFKGNSGSVLHKTEKKGLVMAPNSNFDFAIDWEDKPLETGNYRLKMTATNGEETWSWDENFAIKSESKSLTEQAVNQEETTSEWLYVGIAVAIVGLLSFMIVILKRRKKQD